jgi:putative acetyltransferase
VLEEYGLQPDPDSTDRDLDDLEGNYLNRGGYFWVIEDSGQIVATVGIYRMDETTCELRKMYVLPSQRGQGLGKKLLEFSLQKARDAGYRKMILETATALVEAIALYKKYGFTEYKSEHRSQRCDQTLELTLC